MSGPVDTANPLACVETTTDVSPNNGLEMQRFDERRTYRKHV